jgi:hypothetical protein
MFAQGIEQRGPRIDRQRVILAVDSQGDIDGRGRVLRRRRIGRWRLRARRHRHDRGACRARHEAAPIESGCRLGIRHETASAAISGKWRTPAPSRFNKPRQWAFPHGLIGTP